MSMGHPGLADQEKGRQVGIDMAFNGINGTGQDRIPIKTTGQDEIFCSSLSRTVPFLTG